MSAYKATRASARTIAVPSPWIGVPDAALSIDTPDGEAAVMTLSVAGVAVAAGEGFRVAEAGRWTWLDMPEAEVLATFGSFLAHAIESSDEDARSGWPILADEAADWADALALADEYGTCDRCGEPIDYCQGHGDTADVQERARMRCVVSGLTFSWGGGEYIEVHAESESVPFEAVNVWDYAAGQPFIPRALDAFEARCIEYVREAA